MTAEETLARFGPVIEAALLEALPSSNDTPAALLEAMHYSLIAGGKRLRPSLVLLAAVFSSRVLACYLVVMIAAALAWEYLYPFADSLVPRIRP